MNVTNANATVSDLIPFANYRVSVKCVWLDDDDHYRLVGFWSNAADVSFTTEPAGRSVVIMYKMVANDVDEGLSVCLNATDSHQLCKMDDCIIA